MTKRIKKGYTAPAASVLPPAASPTTDEAVLNWCRSMADHVISSLDMSSVRLTVGAYRYFGEHLTMDFDDALHAEVGIDFHVSDTYRLHENGGSIPDLVEGLHLVGLIATMLQLDARVGDQVGHVRLKVG